MRSKSACFRASLSRFFKRIGVAGHQRLALDHLAYCDLAIDRSQRAHDIVREHHTLQFLACNTATQP